MLRRLHPVWLVTLVAVSLSACAAASPGFVPESNKKNAFMKAQRFESGTVVADGTYQLSQAERDLDCKKLTGSMRVMISRLRSTRERPQPSALAVTAQEARASIKGQPNILDMKAEEIRERGRLDAYNRLLAEKKCQTIDVTTELAKAQPAAR
jgi:hypothetical protein